MSTTNSKTYSYAQIWTVAYPILISLLVEQLIGMTDTAFLGRVGEVELGASALGGILYIAVFMLGSGFSIGAQIMMARRNGEGNYREIGSIFYHSLFFLLAMAAVLFFFTRWAGPLLMSLLVRSSEVCAAADEFLYWRVFSFFFSFVNVLFRAFFVATMRTRTLTLNSLVMVAANFFFTYVFIFGHFGIPAYGIAGAAIGNTLAAATSTLFFVIFTFTRIDCAHYGLNKLPRLRPSMLRRVFGISMWTMLQDFVSLSTWFMFFIGVEHLGERELAATNIVRNVSAFTFMSVIALAATAGTMVGNLMGQGNAASVPRVLRRIIFMGFCIMVPIIVGIFCFPNPVLCIFTNNEELVRAACPALLVMLSSYVFTIPGQILLKAVAGTGNTRMAMVCEIVTTGIYVIFLVVAVFHMRVSLPICWMSEHIYSFFIALFCLLYLKYGHWERKSI